MAAERIQTCKLKPPRELGKSETRESLEPWIDSLRSYYKRDEYFKTFVSRTTRWNPAVPNTYDLRAEEDGLRRTAAQMGESLEDFMSAVAAYFPFSFLKRRLLTTTSFASLSEMIYKVYNIQVNSGSLLRFTHIKKEAEESHYIFYERLLEFFHRHLVGAGQEAAGYNTGGGDQLNLSMANTVAALWLEKYDKHLPDLIQLEYGQEISNNVHLAALVPRIADDMDSLLLKLEDQKERGNKRQRSYKVCGYERNNYDDHDFPPEQNIAGDISTPKLTLQPESEGCDQQSESSSQWQTVMTTLLCNLVQQVSHLSQTSSSHIKSHIPNVHKLEAAVWRLEARKPTRASSPRLLGVCDGTQFVAVIDEGAEINCLDLALVKKLGIPYVPTLSSATAAGSTQMKLAGQTVKDFIFKTEFRDGTYSINLQTAVVIENLGADALCGEPAKKFNALNTVSERSLISLKRGGKKRYKPYHNSSGPRGYDICKVGTNDTIYNDHSLQYVLPEDMQHDSVFVVSPRRSTVPWFRPGIYPASMGKIELCNESGQPVHLTKHQQVADIRPCYPVDIPEEEFLINPVGNPSSNNFKYTRVGDVFPDPPRSPDIVLDPDGVMPEPHRECFRAVSEKYYKIFTNRPGKYNGAYGLVDTSIRLTSRPAPNTKVYMPNYSVTMKKEMGKLMDELMSQGVLQRPESIGVIPEFVSPSLLVPGDDGQWRLVTDFNSLNKHIKKYVGGSPTISETRQLLSQKKYFVHLDFSNYFFQSGVSREDAQYLATFHPFRGLVCYCVAPEGLRNGTESAYEILDKIFGDMCQAERMTRIADSIYPVGDTFEDLLSNYEECLRRAQEAGLTFKPGKTVICPRRTVMFGWELKDGEWAPTSHTMASLSRATLPRTVKALRSFLGSYKQFTECVEDYTDLLYQLEQVCRGRKAAERVVWTEELKEIFMRAKLATRQVKGVHTPRPTDTIHTYSDYSQATRAVGGRMVIVRMKDGKERQLHGGYFSVVLDKFKGRWIPCEAEAAGVRLTLEHFAPYIRESLNQSVHFTDNLPVVQAFKRSLMGAFSNSPRIVTFLTSISTICSDIVHKPGKTLHSADFQSRHPTGCEDPAECQICQFARSVQKRGDEASKIRTISVQEVLDGTIALPFIQRKAWLVSQQQDKVHTSLRRLIQSGQQPENQDMGGPATELRLLYSLYKSGDLRMDKDGLVMTRAKDGYFSGWVISVPSKLMPGIANAIHIKLGHPSKSQQTALMTRYFYSPGHASVIQAVSDACLHCKSRRSRRKF